MAKDKEPTASTGPAPTGQDTTLPIIDPGTAAESVDNHSLPLAPKDWAGRYMLTHGSVRIGEKFYGPGAKLTLGADDGQNFTAAGIAERIEE